MFNSSFAMLASLYCLLFGCTAINSSDLFYRCYDQSIDEYTDIESGNAELVMKILTPSKATVFVTHGWQESCNNRSMTGLTSAFLSRNDHNVCCLDWSAITCGNYISAVDKTEAAATSVATNIQRLNVLGLPPGEPWLIGFSLGAQLFGFTGGKLIEMGSKRLKRITGLDPANPGFYPPTCKLNCFHLNETNADMVEVVHTDAGLFGAPIPTGNCDFFPNCGTRIQTGCPVIPNTLDFERLLPMYRCSHDRSYEYYAEAIRNDDSHVGRKCNSCTSFSSNLCSQNPTVSMGINLPTNCSGTFFYSTNAQGPFGPGIQGTSPFGRK